MTANATDQKTLRFVRTVVEHLELPIPVSLWNGEVLGGGDDFDAEKTLHVHVASPQAVRTVARHPSLDSLVELWSSKQVDLIKRHHF